MTGPATGARGTVIGKHGGINHVIVDFEPAILRRLRIGDRIQITAWGQGLELTEFPSVRALNLSPRLLARWGIRAHGGHLHVPVTHLVPAGIMGSGLGKSDGVLGDCDIQLSDPSIVRRFRLSSLRFGDLVAIGSFDNRFGPSVRMGKITVGVIVHSDSHVASATDRGSRRCLSGRRGSCVPSSRRAPTSPWPWAFVLASPSCARRMGASRPTSGVPCAPARTAWGASVRGARFEGVEALRDHRRARVHVELREDPPQVSRDRPFADLEVGRDLLVDPALRDESHDL